MRIAEFINTRSRAPKRGTVAVAVGWCRLGDLLLDSGELWIGDPQMSWAESREHGGCIVRLRAGRYRVSFGLVTFGQGLFTSRLRVCQQGIRQVTVGKELGQVGTDSAQIGVCDIRAIKRAYEIAFPDYDEAFAYFDKNLKPRAGILRPNGQRGACLPFVESGFGDGMGPVVELRSGAKRVGVDAEFIPDSYAYST